MSYTLQAIIAHERHLMDAVLAGTRVLNLGAELSMIPLTQETREALQMSDFPLTDEGRKSLDANTSELCRQLSFGCRLAYIEAEYFGGWGTQACILFERGTVQEGPLIGTGAINHALRFLGVRASESHDEFDTVGLNQERETKDWVREDAI